MGDPSYYAMCKACWEYYGKPAIYCIAILGGSCRRCGKPNDCDVPRVGGGTKNDPMVGLCAIPTEVILAKDGKLPDPLPEQPPIERAPLRIGIGFKGLACGPENPAAVIEKLNR